MIVDAWMQHPTARFLRQPFLDSLRRWTGNDFDKTYANPIGPVLSALQVTLA